MNKIKWIKHFGSSILTKKTNKTNWTNQSDFIGFSKQNFSFKDMSSLVISTFLLIENTVSRNGHARYLDEKFHFAVKEYREATSTWGLFGYTMP